MIQHLDLVGQEFGSYWVLQLIGRGGFADVYLGEHLHLGTRAAIKVLHAQLARNDIDTFRTEARTIAHLRHPHIIRVLDFNIAGSKPFLVMDYAAGGTMRERYPKGTVIPPAAVASYIQQVGDALQYAHDKKLIHRDVKPENILLDKQHNILLSDFGIALVTQHSPYEASQEVCGTIAYMSPEQLQGKPQPASDQYSLGIVAYEWLVGKRPFEGSLAQLWNQHIFMPPPPLRGIVPTITPEVEQVVMTALAKDPRQRFPSVNAFATALQQAVGTTQRAQADRDWPLPLQAPMAPVQQISFQQTAGNGQVQVDREHSGDLLQLQESPHVTTAPLRPITSPRLQTSDASFTRSLDEIRPQGSPKWVFSTNGPVTSSPTVVNGIVYFGSHDNNLYALDTATGQLKWSFRSGHTIHSSPTVVNGIVYFGSYDCNLYALDAATGQLRWSFPTKDVVRSSPIVVNGIVYFGSWDNHLYALDATHGRKIWAFRTGDWVQSSPTIVNGMLYFGSDDHNLYALDAASGRKKWSFRTGKGSKKQTLSSPTTATTSPTVSSGIVYFGASDHRLYALDAVSGQLKWAFATNHPIASSPVMIDSDILYFGSHDHNLYALYAATGQLKGTIPTGNAIELSPTVVDGTIYFGSDDRYIYAVDALSSQLKWSYQTGGRVQSSPAVVDGVLYAGSYDRNFYAIFA